MARGRRGAAGALYAAEWSENVRTGGFRRTCPDKISSRARARAHELLIYAGIH